MTRAVLPDHARRLAAAATRALLSGQLPDAMELDSDSDPEQLDLLSYGLWRDGLRGIIAGLLRDGAAGADTAWRLLCRTDPAWIGLLAADAPRQIAAERVPSLPDDAQAVMDVLEPAGVWLDLYLTYAQAAVPMAPPSFHEACGLIAASTAIARRCKVVSGTKTIYPNLWYLLVAPPGRYRKSATLDVAELVAYGAGLRHLLLKGTLTPEALVEEMSPEWLPPALPKHKRAEHAEGRRWANTRSWVRDEIHSVFQGASRDYNAALLPMLLEIYDGKSIRQRTKSRGVEEIQEPYLTILGASTPGAMHKFLSGREYWDNGLWSRFILLQPEHTSEFEVEAELPEPPAELTRRLRALRDLFPEPEIDIVEDPKSKDAHLQHKGVSAVGVTVEKPAWAAWTAYRKACEHTMLGDENDPTGLPEMLHATYTRLPLVAIKVATVLAALDAADSGVDGRQVIIELRHYARAQRIVERYRATLHSFFETNVRTEESALQSRILARLRKSKTPLTAHDLCEALRATAREMAESLLLLSRAGHIAKVEDSAKNGKRVELWTVMEREPLNGS